MAQQDGQGLAFQGTQVQFPVTTWELTTIYNSSSRRSNALFWFLWTSSTYVVYRPTCRQNTYMHKNNLKINKLCNPLNFPVK